MLLAIVGAPWRLPAAQMDEKQNATLCSCDILLLMVYSAFYHL